jgi:hypothetical protein
MIPFFISETLMRAKQLSLIGILALLLSSCSSPGEGKGGHAPAPPNKDLLPGKWTNPVENQLITAYEFAGDGTVKVTVAGMERPLAAKYKWSGDRALALEYPTAAEVRQAYAVAVKAYKDRFMARIKAKEMPDRAANSLSVIEDELPAKETLTIAMSEKPVQIFLTDAKGTRRTFAKAD